MQLKSDENSGYKFYSSQDALLNDIDVAVIVTPRLTHFDIAKRALEYRALRILAFRGPKSRASRRIDSAAPKKTVYA